MRRPVTSFLMDVFVALQLASIRADVSIEIVAYVLYMAFERIWILLTVW